MAEFRVGLVGLGEISSYFINAVENHPRSEMVAVCRRKPREGNEYSQYTYYTDWKDLVNDERVNVVIIATPPSTHAVITEHALRLKKRVISEKPFSTNLADAHNCAALAKEQQTHLNFAYHAAMNPLSLMVKERVDKMLAAGDWVTGVQVEYKEYVQNYHSGQSWVFDAAISGGGVLIDSGVNAISIVEHLCGTITPLTVQLEHNGSFPVESNASVTFSGNSLGHEFHGSLVQDWLWQGPEQRQVTISFASSVVISFCFAQGFITTNAPASSPRDELEGTGAGEWRLEVMDELEGGRREVREVEVKNKQDTDVHLTPMSLEYVKVIEFAFQEFDKPEFVDSLGVGPFEFVMKCYDMTKK